MKRIITAMLAAAVVFSAFGVANAQLPVSRTNAIELTDLTGGQIEFVAIRTMNEPRGRGVITAVSGDNVTIDGVSATFAGDGWVGIVSTGVEQGRVFEINEATSSGTIHTLTGFSAFAASIEVDVDDITVVKKQTLDEAFPAGGSFTGGATLSSADQLIIFGSTTVQAFYNSSVGEWQNPAGLPVGATLIPMNGSVVVIPQSSTPGDALVSGVRNTGDVQFSVPAGITSVGVPYKYSSSLTLDDLLGSIDAGATLSSADQVLFASSGSLNQVFRNTSPAQWQTPSGTPVAGTTIIGEGFIVIGNSTVNTIAFVEEYVAGP